MKRLTRSATYVRIKLLFGLAFACFGVVIIVQGVSKAGPTSAAIVPILFGAALIGLGALRVRDFLRLRTIR